MKPPQPLLGTLQMVWSYEDVVISVDCFLFGRRLVGFDPA